MKARILNPLAAVAVAGAVYMAFGYAPTEAVQGDAQRIFYLHVPSAWVSYLAYGIVAWSSVQVLRDKSRNWDRLAGASAEVGVIFTSVVLVTGPIWGYPVWGTPWAWDARLTSTLLLWVIFVGYLIFRSATPQSGARARRCAVIGLVGAADIPIIHFAVVWWRTLHPAPIVLRPEGPDLPSTMLLTLAVSFVAYTLLFFAMLRTRYSLEEPEATVV